MRKPGRKIVYVPDDDAQFLGSMSDPLPPRVSDLLRLKSPSMSDNGHAETGSNGTTGSPGYESIGNELLVSYGGYTLADGSGTLHPPTTRRNGAQLYKSLRKCCRFLRASLSDSMAPKLETDSESSWSCPSFCSSDPTSSSEYSDVSPQRGRRRAAKQANEQTGYNAMIVVQLRRLLHKRGLSTCGIKKVLVARLEQSDMQLSKSKEEGEEQKEQEELDGSAGECTKTERSEDVCSASCGNVSGRVTAAGPTSMLSSLLSFGSRLFRASTGSVSESGHVSGLKRRRSV
ncbi:hypothetical protein, conserved [Trypanosoma brucei gambiense DAL972]|uniref:SAP domain-containing protein n=2 Tax=Trypanosoma brucei TaxID=5691 RepID=D0A2G8_TRYB9|nr:hypothetical protein, conserved [Trypanosoma brucei gambiense DAL972]RHW69386.1 SAP domain containing protein [Trypanosoma brucei equiperdum]CBH15462.1 hypothetical protein, conserved [Trypanosoma brucei gambiense DAL972]|eukprot:XP_011777726.1 hypothetical protein, conserved [Trypanosoma brucei gambiense DAL972]